MFPIKHLLPKNKLEIVSQITCFFWFCAKIISYKLWLSDRTFPLLPIFDFLDYIPNSIHLFLFTLSLVGISLIAFFPKNKYFLLTTLSLELFSCMLDQNRWQPWEYQYNLIILFLFLYRNNPKQFINYFVFLMATIYINSGLHKISGSFLYHVWENMILKHFFGFSTTQLQNLWIHYSGLSLGVIEVLLGIALLFSKSQKKAAILLMAMHLFILLLISPIGLNYNSIVWPWNVAMILFLYFVFIKGNNNKVVFENLIIGYNKIIFSLIGIAPLFNFFGYWDDYLSFNLYSGNSKRLEICIPKNAYIPEYQKFFSKKSRFCESCYVLKGNEWALKEMNTVLYPENRLFMGLIKKWKQKYPKTNTTFYIYKYPYGPKDIQFYH